MRSMVSVGNGWRTYCFSGSSAATRAASSGQETTRSISSRSHLFRVRVVVRLNPRPDLFVAQLAGGKRCSHGRQKTSSFQTFLNHISSYSVPAQMLNSILAVAFSMQLISLSLESQLAAQLIQVGAVLLICTYATWALMMSGESLNITIFPTESAGIFLAIGVPLLSVAALAVNRNSWIDGGSLMIQSVLLCLTALAIRLLVNWKPQEFLRAALFSYISMAILVIAVDYDMLWRALALETADNGRVRFSPLNNHPNLVAHVFSSGVLLAFGALIYGSSPSRRKFCFIVLAAQLLIVLATSSRGALVALIPALLAMLLHAYGARALISANVLSFFSVLLASALAWLVFGQVIQGDASPLSVGWLVDLLEVNSEYRGLESGGSGRLELWPIVLEKAAATAQSTLIGNGYRSWSIEYFGFSIDNSYINLAWEFGFIAAIVIVIVLFQQYVIVTTAPSSHVSTVATGVLTFILVDSIFARYLIGIGNATSLLALSFFLLERRTMYASARKKFGADDTVNRTY